MEHLVPLDYRMSRILHVLIHMDQHLQRATSKDLSEMLQTNPVVIRRMMGGLRDSGFVKSTKGQGGGWELACKLSQLSLYDVFQAIGSPSLFSMASQNDNPDCLVEQIVDAQMDKTLSEAEQLIMQQFKKISVGDLSAQFEILFEQQHGSHMEHCAK